MKNKQSARFIIGCLLGLIFFSQKIYSQTVDEIVAKHTAALGGKEKMDSLKTVFIEGTFRLEAFELPLKAYLEQNVGQRFNVVVLKTPGFIIVTPQQGWQYFPFQGMKEPMPLRPEDIEIYSTNLDLQGPLHNYKEKGNTIIYKGLEEVEESVCYKLSITLKSGKQLTGFVDTVSNYLIKTSLSIVTKGKETFFESLYGNFQKTPEGFVIPFAMTLGPGKAFVSKILINGQLNSSVFDSQKAKTEGF